jgi:hypothetical protein
MPAPVATLQGFCQTKTDNAGRPGDAGRIDLTIVAVRPTHLRTAEDAKPEDPNPGVFANENAGAVWNFGDVTEAFAAKFKRGKKYAITFTEIE